MDELSELGTKEVESVLNKNNKNKNKYIKKYQQQKQKQITRLPLQESGKSITIGTKDLSKPTASEITKKPEEA